MTDFFRNILNTDGFPPRWHCGDWSAGHGWLHIISDSLIFAAYFTISGALGYFLWKKRKEVSFPFILWLFGMFILACGITHLIEVTLFWTPWYRLSGISKLITALVSWGTVWAILRAAPKALKFPGMAKLNRELEATLQAQKETEEKLAHSNRELEQFATIVSHDLRTPIFSSILMAEKAQEAQQQGDRATAERQLQELCRTLTRSSRLVKDLHHYALLGSNGNSLGPVALASTMDEVLSCLRHPIETTGAKITIGKLPTVMGEDIALTQVFNNLLENALKYAGDKPPQVTISAEPDGDYWDIDINDEGVGIKPDGIDTIFEPFVRLNEDKSIPGSGLGLAVCAKLLEKIGGSISVTSELNHGTTFTIRLQDASNVMTAGQVAPGRDSKSPVLAS